MISHEAFVTALIAQLPGLRRYATALVGRTALADDLVQDSMERGLRQWEQLRDLSLMAAWLRRILHNLHIDDIRRGRSRGPQQDVSELSDDLQLSVAAQDGGRTRDFLRALERLSLEHRQILLLVGLEDLSYRQIAEELDIPIGTVMSRLARARERLRELMEKGVVVPFAPGSKGVS